MVYIRAKKVKSDQYLYLVKSVWDSKKSTSKQEIIKYLGKASDVVSEDIPLDYRTDSKILSAIAKYNPNNIKNNEVAIKKIKEKLYKNLTEGEIQESIKIYQEHIKNFDSTNFFDEILKLVMYKIGDDWEKEGISIATEHIASNTAQILVRTILEQVSGNAKKKKILICVPVGEEHRLGCDVLETYLSSKGFKIYNMGTSIPTESILSFIENNNPDVVFLSITLKDNIKAGQRLVKKIKEQSKIPILVGGFAIQKEMSSKFDAKVMTDVKLDEIPKILKKI